MWMNKWWISFKVIFDCSMEKEGDVPQYILSRIKEKRGNRGNHDLEVVMVGNINESKYNK